GRERADVQLVDDELVEREALPPVVRPAEGRRVDDPRGASNALRLEPRARVGPLLHAVEEIDVVAPDRGAGGAREEAVLPLLERGLAGPERDGNRPRLRSPDAEVDHAAVAGHGAQERPRIHGVSSETRDGRAAGRAAEAPGSARGRRRAGART